MLNILLERKKKAFNICYNYSRPVDRKGRYVTQSAWCTLHLCTETVNRHLVLNNVSATAV